MSVENSSGSFEQEPQQDPIIQEILGDLYKPEKILAKKVEQVSEGEFKITFEFPPYDRTIEPLDHVSMSQMHEAVLDGALCAIGQVLKNQSIKTNLDYQEFMDRRQDIIYYRENFSFRKMLKANESTELIFQIVNVEEKKLRRTFYSATIKIDGFMRGEIEALLEKV